MKILIAEDDDSTLHLLETHVKRWGYETVTTKSGDEALRLLMSSTPPNVAILDWMMPGVDGIQACQRVRARHAEPYIYIIMLTTKTQRADVIQGLNAGADDYISKPFDVLELQARLSTGKRICELQAHLIEARERIRYDACHDMLTGLLSRAEVTKILQRDASRACRENTNVSVAMIDLDFFKQVNDTYGHDAGDAVLREAAKRFGLVLRPYDSIGRHGGEEFLAVFPGCDAVGALSVAARLRSRLAGSQIGINDAEKVTVTCSIGVATARGAGLNDPAALVKAADMALYQAKQRGRNCVVAAPTPAEIEELLKAAPTQP